MKRFLWSLFLATLTVGLPVCFELIGISSQEALAAPRKPDMIVKIAPAVKRTQAEIEQAEASGLVAPLPSSDHIDFRPTMDEDEYLDAKEAATARGATSVGKRENAPVPLPPPVLKSRNFEGINQTQAGGLIPPDTHGAVGNTQFVEIVNTRLRVFNKTGGQLSDVSLASFFGYFAQTLFDPRVVYDPVWDRWIVTAEARPESPTVQLFFIAVSTTSSATGSFFIYALNVNFFANSFFFDYPQLGYDQDAVIITANIFNGNAFVGTDLFAIAKAALYNGLGFSVPVFTNLCGTLAPPIVLDQNANAYLVCAPTSGSSVTKYTLTNASNALQTGLTASTISVPAYNIPPLADQCGVSGTANRLDTLDSRFINASTQVGDSLFQVHTIALGPFPTPMFYEFDTEEPGANTIKQRGFFFKSGSSDDFNASIAANSARDVYVTWSATDPGTSPCTNAQVRFSGRRFFDTAGVITAGSALFTSPTALTGNFDPNRGFQRWGDYSAVTVDPTNQLFGWVVNEKINNANTWGSRIGRIGF